MSLQSTGVLGVDITRADSSATQKLGTCVEYTAGQTYMYVLAAEAIGQYLTVGVDEDGNASKLTKTIADDGWTIGFAQAALASGEYGWVALRGRGEIYAKTLTDCAADVILYTSSTAGYLDDDSSSQTRIAGVVATSAATSATSTTVEIIATWPRSNGF